MHVLCPHCKNPIELVRLDPSREVTCTACGSTFRVDDGSTTGWVTPVGQSIGRFSVVETVGHGGFGTVFRARDPELDRTVAVKVPRRGNIGEAPQDLDRFLREARSVAQLRHPGIVSVHEVGMLDGTPYLVSDFVEGLTLSDLLTARRPAPRDAARLVADVADALQHAHEQGVIHRDVKPSNIMVRPDGAPVVMDFGLAKREAGEVTMTLDGQVLGTPAYMSPEQARGEGHRVDGRSDIYSLGVILYLLLTGELPFRGNVRMLLHQVLHDEPKAPRSLNDRVPRDLETVTLKAMAKDPAKRYATAAELSADLGRFLAGEPVLARPVGPVDRASKWVRRNPVVTGATAAVVLALAAGATASYLKYRDAEAARRAEAQRVAERDEALAREAERVKERDAAIGKRDQAVVAADARAGALKYRLGVSNMVLASNAYDNRDPRLAAERLDAVPPEQRGWEWRYLKRQTEGGIFTLYGHTDFVRSVAYSPDGGRVATASQDKTARVWDARTGESLVEFKGHTNGVTGVAFSPDGGRVATASEDRTARVWDARTGESLVEFKGHTSGVTGVAFSPDGARLVTGSWDNTARVWDSRTGTALVQLRGSPPALVYCVAFSPDGARVAAGNGDQTARVWDARTGALVAEFKGHTAAVGGVSFSPDGARVATGGWDGSAKVWDSYTGSPVIELQGRGGLAFSPDGARVVTAGRDKTARVWDARTGESLVELQGHAGAVMCASYSPDGSRVVTGSGDKTARVWDARSGESLVELKGHTDELTSVAFSPGGDRVVSASLDDTARVWDARSGESLVELKGHTRAVMGGCFSPDGARVLTGSLDYTARVWDAKSGDPTLELRHVSFVLSVAFSPDGSRVLTGSEDQTARAWDARSGVPLIAFKGHTSIVRSAVYSPDGARVLTGSLDRTARVWDARTGDCLVELRGHPSLVSSVAFSPDGRRVAAGSWVPTTLVWDAPTGAAVIDLGGHTSLVTSVSYSPDGTRVVTGSEDRTARVWDARTGESLVELKGHTGFVTSAAFSPDGRRVATASEDRTARVWDARTGESLVELKGHTGFVTSVGFNPGGDLVVTGSRDRTARVWDARSGKMVLELKPHGAAVYGASFNSDGSRIVTGSFDEQARVWDARTGRELKMESGPVADIRRPVTPDGRTFAFRTGSSVRLVPLTVGSEEFESRLINMRTNYQAHVEGYDAARQANDGFAAAFHLDRLLSIPGQRTPERFRDRSKFASDPRPVARATFHHSDLANSWYDRDVVQAMAAGGDRLAKRLVAQARLREGEPRLAIPLLYECLLARPVTDPPSPPVEELLLALAYQRMNRPDEAKRFYRVATGWLDRLRDPVRAVNVISHAINPWNAAGVTVGPIHDPRHNPFDWESWHECDVFRAEFERTAAMG